MLLAKKVILVLWARYRSCCLKALLIVASLSPKKGMFLLLFSWPSFRYTCSVSGTRLIDSEESFWTRKWSAMATLMNSASIYLCNTLMYEVSTSEATAYFNSWFGSASFGTIFILSFLPNCFNALGTGTILF